MVSPLLKKPLSIEIPKELKFLGFIRTFSAIPIKSPSMSMTSFPSMSSEVIASDRLLPEIFFLGSIS